MGRMRNRLFDDAAWALDTETKEPLPLSLFRR